MSSICKLSSGNRPFSLSNCCQKNRHQAQLTKEKKHESKKVLWRIIIIINRDVFLQSICTVLPMADYGSQPKIHLINMTDGGIAAYGRSMAGRQNQNITSYKIVGKLP